VKILRMTASFGRLDREELALSDGLNVLTAPNEAGKSTWSAFLLAMLYGIDTAERASRGNLPAKTRFRPWDGAAMEGRIDLLWRGKHISIERTSAGRAPMGAFRAYETDTGRPLDFLTADNCGQTLFGVERSVYERSGFIRQQGLALTGDAALETRLASLVTTGEEDVSFSQTDKRLRDLLNRRRHNRTGLLPQAEAELESVKNALAAIRADGEEAMRLRARQAELEDGEARLSRLLDALRRRETEEKRAQLESARAAWEKERGFLAEKQAAAAGLPPLGELQELLRQLDLLAENGRALEADLRLGVETPGEPECPPVFAGLSADQVRETAETDAARLDGLRRPVAKSRLLPVLAACFALAAAVFFFLLPPAAIVLLAAALGCAIPALLGAARARKQAAANAESARALLARYGAADASGIRASAAKRREALLLYEQRRADAECRRGALARRQAEFDARRDELLAKARAFAPVAGADTVRSAVQQAVYRRQFCDAAETKTRQARERYEAVRAAVGPLTAPSGEPLPELPDPVPDENSVAARLAETRRALSETRSQLALRRGRMESAGDPAELAARAEELSGKTDLLQRQYDALLLARETLDAANAELQTRFSPRLNALAGELAAKMTGARYDQVLLAQDMTVEARPTDGVVTRPLAALSGGTADQLYLAVRLAICELALGPEAPLVLDDALVNFDDERMAAALSLLRGEAKTRQILLFTCQAREQAWLAGHPGEA